MPRELNEKLYANFLLPANFVKRWKNGILDERYIYLDFSADMTYEVDVDNQPFIQKLFSMDESFDSVRVEKQWEKISFLARKIIDLRIIDQNKIALTKQEILFLKYFNFLISLVNGDHKFYFDRQVKSYRSFDILSTKVDYEIRHKLLIVLEYALFEMFDVLLTDALFSKDLQTYIDESRINFAEHTMFKRVVIPNDELENQTFRFLQANFFFTVNHTFIKIFRAVQAETLSFYLTNKSIVNFIDEKTKMTLLSAFVIDPHYAIGFINLGPGRGEYRPLFQYFKNTALNKIMFPAVLMPEHKLTGTGVYLDDVQKFEFTPYPLTQSQINQINEGLTIRQLKLNLSVFYKNQ
jgi:hypothetical protein